MTPRDISARAATLRERLEEATHAYYVLDAPVMPARPAGIMSKM